MNGIMIDKLPTRGLTNYQELCVLRVSDCAVPLGVVEWYTHTYSFIYGSILINGRPTTYSFIKSTGGLYVATNLY
jgi:hypothetical protein